MIEVNRHYSRSRMEHMDEFGVFKLTEYDKYRLGLKKKDKPPGNIHIVVPLHYGSKGVWWESKYVFESDMPEMYAKYPNLQVIGGRCLSA